MCVDEHFVSAQLKITSEDGFHFDNIKDKKTVIPVIHDEGIGDARHTRDPKVWKDGERWHMVLGSTIEDKQENFCSAQVQMEKNGNLRTCNQRKSADDEGNVRIILK